jgi:sarcosine oxidase, subunit beta
VPVNYVTELPRRAELVIIGGGIVGTATALFARRAGLKPLLIERRDALCTLTTPASTGAYRLQFDNKEELDLVRESVDVFWNFEAATNQDEYDASVRRQGYLWLTMSERRAEEQRSLVARQHEWGQRDIEVVSGEDVRARWPYVDPRVVQARWRADDGFLDPKKVTMGFAAGSRAAVVVGCAVVGFETRAGALTRVRTSRGAVSTDTAVIAAGPFSGVVASTAGVDLPVTTVARHKVVFPELPSVPRDAPMTIDDDTGAHWRPALGGAFCLFTDPTTPSSPPTENVAPDHPLALRLLDPSSPVALARVAPFWKEVWDRNAAYWLLQSGQYTMTPDHRPLLGETEVAGLFVNTGYSGHGIMGAPAGSRHLVDVMTNEIAPETNEFRLARDFAALGLDLL